MSACGVVGCDSGSGAAGGVCAVCWARRTTHLAELPELWLRVRGVLPPGSRVGEGGAGHAPPGPRPPLAVCALDALRAAPNALLPWANMCLPPGAPPVDPRGKRWGFLLSEVAHTLAALDSCLCGDYRALEYVSTLARQHHRLALLAGLSPRVAALPAPCPRCRRRSLWRHLATEAVYCTHEACGSRWLGPEFARVVLAELAAQGG